MPGISYTKRCKWEKLCDDLLGDGDPGTLTILDSPNMPKLYISLSEDTEERLPIDESFMPDNTPLEVFSMVSEDWHGTIRVLQKEGDISEIHFKNKQEFIDITYERFIDNNYESVPELCNKSDIEDIYKLTGIRMDPTYLE